MNLVTGGAGYIGSHLVKELVEAGEEVVVLDNLSTGYKRLLNDKAVFYQGSCGDLNILEEIFTKHKIKNIFHFAASLSVPESVERPEFYYENNVVNSIALFSFAVAKKVESIVFSSTCAVYGNPASNPVTTKMPLSPVSPYGATKLCVEYALKNICEQNDSQTKYSILRYFNVAGAHPDMSIGQIEGGQLLKVLSEVASGKRASITVYGNDYDTHDGTCVRDYVHVVDLARAHVKARGKGESKVHNLGYGKGFSVLEIIAAFEKALGDNIKKEFGPRRAGDAKEIYSAKGSFESLGLNPEFNDIELICKTALDWEKKLNESEL